MIIDKKLFYLKIKDINFFYTLIYIYLNDYDDYITTSKIKKI